MDDNEVDEDLDGDAINYYAILNVNKEASEDEIKGAYKVMAARFHPDKHIDPKLKETASIYFDRVQKSYEVLSDSTKRMIYDIYGQKGLDAGWDMVERQRSPAEIHLEYERLQREAEERRVQQKTNPKGAIALQIDASDLFSDQNAYSEYDPDYRWLESLLSPPISIQGMSISQSIETPLTRSKTATMAGSLQHNKDGESGMMNCTLRNVFSPDFWGELEAGVGSGGGEFSLRGFRNLTKKYRGVFGLTTTHKQYNVKALMHGRVETQLTKTSTLYVSGLYNLGGLLTGSENSYLPRSMSTMITHNTERYNLLGQISLTAATPSALLSYTHKVSDDTRVKGTVQCSLLGGVAVEYSCEHKVTSLSTVIGSVNAGSMSGITLRIKVLRHTQTFDFPIFLSEVFSPRAMFYGTVTPLVVFFGLKAIASHVLAEQKEKDLEEKREMNADVVAEKRKEALAAVELMKKTYEANVAKERDKKGLVIIDAWYGKFISQARPQGETNDNITPFVINVKIPIQCLVKDSKLLVLGDSPKSQLTGMYDPCIGEEKMLKIRYEFRDNIHEAVFQDTQPVRMPVPSHRISTKIS